MKNIKRNSLIVGIVTILVLIFILKDNFDDIVNNLVNANIWWILLTILVYLIYFIFDQLAIYKIVKQYNEDINFNFIIYLGIITKFFNGVTPLASGGQPMQIYELHKKNISVANGTNIVIQNYIVFQIALVILGVIAYILNHSIVKLGIKFLSILKKNIDQEKEFNKWDKFCDDYYDNAKILLSNKKTFLLCIIDEFISLTLYYAIPYTLAYSLGFGHNLTLINTIAAGSYIYIMGCYVPIPGATGGMEYGFMGFFGNFLSGGQLSALMVLWRFITYYLPTIIGAVVFNIGPGKDCKEALKEGKIK